MREVQNQFKKERNPTCSNARLKQDAGFILNHIEKYVGKIGKSIHDQAFDLAPLMKSLKINLDTY
ncbi:hypothetical protein LCGC14_1639560 [marine sediment metagenome]|uniref:Uncharacterized protein n=1 Tax=marine sediment metagenome TaxID=412755 RepID=A0A0F9KZN0_9ZZZZ